MYLYLTLICVRLVNKVIDFKFPDKGELERSHNQDFFDKIRIVKEYGILDEFIDAAKEEEYGLQKIIEAYDKRIINQSRS